MTGKKLYLAISVVVLCILTGAGVFAFDAMQNSKSSNSTSNLSSTNSSTTNLSSSGGNQSTSGKTGENNSPSSYTLPQLSKFDGLNGNKCYVAVDGKVYDLSNFSLWRNGIHTTSGGLASCGRELSNVITQSPHGKSRLKIVPEVGVFSN